MCAKNFETKISSHRRFDFNYMYVLFHENQCAWWCCRVVCICDLLYSRAFLTVKAYITDFQLSSAQHTKCHRNADQFTSLLRPARAHLLLLARAGVQAPANATKSSQSLHRAARRYGESSASGMFLLVICAVLHMSMHCMCMVNNCCKVWNFCVFSLQSETKREVLQTTDGSGCHVKGVANRAVRLPWILPRCSAQRLQAQRRVRNLENFRTY